MTAPRRQVIRARQTTIQDSSSKGPSLLVAEITLTGAIECRIRVRVLARSHDMKRALYSGTGDVVGQVDGSGLRAGLKVRVETEPAFVDHDGFRPDYCSGKYFVSRVYQGVPFLACHDPAFEPIRGLVG